LVLAALPLTEAHAQERPANGLIAFGAQRAGTRVIYTRASNGTQLRLIRTGTPADHPVFSPRGKRLLFTRQGNSGSQVWVSYLDGRGMRALTPGPSDGMATWSPVGGQVVFARGRRGRRDLYKVFADGSGLTRLTFSSRDDVSPSWSVKNRIAFVRSSGKHSHVYVMSANGGAARRLTRGTSDEVTPAWSPTGRTLVLAAGKPGRRDLFLVTADGAHSRRLTKVPGDDSEPAWSPDGSRIVFTHKRGGKRRLYVMKVRGKPITRLPTRSLRVRRLTTSGSRSGLPSWQPTGLAPLVAAAGDIACDPESPYFNDGLGIPGSCRQKLTSDLLLREDLTSVFPLGDDQYEDGQLSKFQRSFDPSWGRLKWLMHPVAGNHEYEETDAAGYFDYFNGVGEQEGPAGDRTAGYYSLDVGSWHVIVLNSECEHIGGCGAGSPQMTWLRSDLESHPVACTMAVWHRPSFSSGGHTDGGDMLPAWNLLYTANADLILNGHEHFYERFAPQTPAGAVDFGRGIPEIIAGMGGRSRFGFTDPQPNSEFESNSFYGVLNLTLRDGAYDWQAIAAPSGRAVDSGSASCH
jgi:WD40 repeat protein/calcineurin-like phosphoesterase family protein